MKITDRHTKHVFIMPRIEEKYLNRAKKSELKILYYIFAHGGLIDVGEACRALEESADAVHAALAFWRCAGVLEEEPEDAAGGVKTAEPVRDSSASFPAPPSSDGVHAKETGNPPAPSDSYTLSEIAAARDKNAEFASLVSYLEKLTGRLYNAAEQGIVLFLYDTLGIGYEVIMGVAQYCVSKGKSSVRYIQKTAMNLHDEGVRTYAELEAHLNACKKRDDYREKIKRMIGAERALSKPECAHIDRWEREGCSEELVALAYEKTVAKINKPQIAYMSRILEGWLEKGLTTRAAVEEYFGNPDNRANGAPEKAGGRLEFNLDDIFEKPDFS